MINTIFGHRSIRKFRNEGIDPEMLNTILEAGSRASNTGNMQVYSIIATTDEGLKQELHQLHFKQQMVLDAPVHLTFCVDIERFNVWCKLRNANPGYDNFLWFCNATIDAVLASQNCALAAESFGLGICYLGTTLYNADKIIEMLKIPKGVFPITAVVMGYPEEIPDLTDRLPIQAIVHNQVFEPYTETDINSFYREKENLPQTHTLIQQNGTENLAQIFTDKRYKKNDNEMFSEKLIATIKEQGLM